MKKFLMLIAVLLAIYFVTDYIYYFQGDIFFPHKGKVTYISKAEGDQLFLDKGAGFEAFELRGVDLGLGKPGYFATEEAITKEEYLRWFDQIQDLGANVIRVYTIGPTDFYEAFYEYNQDREEPLYLLHGVWVDDYLHNSSYGAVDPEFYEPFEEACKTTVDIVHGRYKVRKDQRIFPQKYDKDISPWVYGYLLGVEWEPSLVNYTDRSFEQLPQYDGEYFYTENASNFEIFLANTGEEIVSYETEKYGTQKMIAFSNWPTTDPLHHSQAVIKRYFKSAKLDVEHIKHKKAFASGQFASYHIYPYYPDYYSYLNKPPENTYLEYLTDLNKHHTMPVVISEFGIPSSRGIASTEKGGWRNQGHMSEKAQGKALVSMYKDIKKAGSAGAIVFSWQDEWFKRTWNTISRVDLETSVYWNDDQTNEQHFGLLSFDPGEEKSICYVDGNKEEWNTADVVTEQEEYRLSMKYDEKDLYFLIEKKDLDLEKAHMYIPIDTTSKSGSKTAKNLKQLEMSQPADFVIELDGKENSRVWVQERYDGMNILYFDKLSNQGFFSADFPEKDSSQFHKILLLLQEIKYYQRTAEGKAEPISFSEYDYNNTQHFKRQKVYETGKLNYGNGNPEAENFNSLADFCSGDGFAEIRIPWQLLNFADPSTMRIHDDYYECLGVEYIRIDQMYVGVGDGSETIQMAPFQLEKLGKQPAYHERLKESYYILQEYWNTKGVE